MVGGSKTLYEEIYGEPLPEHFKFKQGTIEHREALIFKSGGLGGVFMLRRPSATTILVFGQVSIEYPTLGQIHFLEKYFRNPFRPTEEERILFEIEFGIKYPLKNG